MHTLEYLNCRGIDDGHDTRLLSLLVNKYSRWLEPIGIMRGV
jgi:hypothetical protein